MSTHHHQDTTPPPLCAILDGFGELFPLSAQAGPVSLIINDHAMDEFWLEASHRSAGEQLRDPEISETGIMCARAEQGLLALLLGMPEDMRLGQGRWAPIHQQALLADGQPSAPDGEPAGPVGDIDDLVHPDDASGGEPAEPEDPVGPDE